MPLLACVTRDVAFLWEYYGIHNARLMQWVLPDSIESHIQTCYSFFIAFRALPMVCYANGLIK
jgi:hypothetical protein